MTRPADFPVIDPERAPKGAIILAGVHGALAVARMLARQGLKIWYLTDYSPMPGYSRHVSAWRHWEGAEHPHAIGVLEDLVRSEGLEDYLLIPAADAEVKFCARFHERLSAHLHVFVPPWSELEWAVDKSRYAERARSLGLEVPRTFVFQTEHEAEQADIPYPVILKPAMRLTVNDFVRAKAWRADEPGSFKRLFAEASRQVGLGAVVVQELIPGGTETQLSYAGLWWKGAPVTEMVARRTRQYPIEFGTATLVDAVSDPEVLAAGRTFLQSIGHHGLCEVEFKRDPRDGRLRLLDVNPRPWSWIGLAEAVGIDFGEAICDLYSGRLPRPMTAKPGAGWLFVLRDLLGIFQALRAGKLDVGAYFGSLFRVRRFATFALTDPLPALLEVPLVLWRAIKRLTG